MKVSTLAFYFPALLIAHSTPTLANDGLELTVKYYTDSNCQDWNKHVAFHPSTDGNCYNYAYSGTRSAKLVDWPVSLDDLSWRCTYYSGYDCVGEQGHPASEGRWQGNCANTIGFYRSVECWPA
jgi:hypothetical protein